MPNQYGAYPHIAAVNKYISETSTGYASNTQAERRRKVLNIVKTLVSQGAPKDPAKINEDNIRTWYTSMEARGLKVSHLRKMVRYLTEYLEYYENNVLKRMKVKRQIRVPKDTAKEIQSLSRASVKQIHEATLDMLGWDGEVAQLITLLYPCTGTRPTELRTLKYGDLNQNDWTITVSHPKGEATYGNNRKILILPQAIQVLKKYLLARRYYLMDHDESEGFEALIPNFKRKTMSYWTYGQFENLKMVIESRSGIEFKTKDYRATFCQWAIDDGVPLQAVSKAMGHASSRTTELYYGRIRDDSAIQEFRRVYPMEPEISQIHS
jgi:integrase